MKAKFKLHVVTIVDKTTISEYNLYGKVYDERRL